MNLTTWKITYRQGWDVHYYSFPHAVQERIQKKIEQMKQPLQGRGMHGTRYMIEEVEQYRIAYILDNASRIKNIHFIGNHKQYEKWYTRIVGFHDMPRMMLNAPRKEIILITK